MIMQMKLANLFYEAGRLKAVKRSGWWLCGVKDPESVAEHSHRAALIAYCLAKTEGLSFAQAEHCAALCVFHDLPEARVGDAHKVAQRYSDSKSACAKAAKEQADSAPKEVGNGYALLFEEFEKQKTREAIIAKDADLLECCAQAREYEELGFKAAREWFENCGKHLKTSSAKMAFKELGTTKPGDWFSGLKA